MISRIDWKRNRQTFSEFLGAVSDRLRRARLGKVHRLRITEQIGCGCYSMLSVKLWTGHLSDHTMGDSLKCRGPIALD